MASKTETIDSRILRLIGLEDVFDLDYGTYASLLKEALVKYGVVGKDKIPTEEIELLREEYKRVKREEGRFKVKSKKINLGNLPTLKISNKSVKVSPPKLLPAATAKVDESVDVKDKKPRVKKDTLESLVASIKKSVTSIEKSLASLNALTKSQIETKRREDQRISRSEREGKMEEKKPSMLGKVAKKIIKPFENIFEKIFRFIFFTLLGNVVTRIIEWWNNPDNKEKIDTIFRFLKDHWPAITAAVLLFGTSFGRMTLRLGAMITKFAFRITRFIIPKLFKLGKSLLRFAIKNPLMAAGALVVGGAAAGMVSQSMKPSNDPERAAEGKTQLQDTQEFGGTTGDPMSVLGGRYSGGGQVPGSGSKDTVPAMLTPGEFVISKGAVNAFGADTFASMNAAGGGTNEPKISAGALFANGGGLIGDEGKKEKPPSSGLRKGSPGDNITDVGQRLDQLMKSTSPEKISKYDDKHGKGSYEKKLFKKLEEIHGSIGKIEKTSKSAGKDVGEKANKLAKSVVKPAPTGKVVGRENLPINTQKLLAKMDALRASGKGDMLYSNKDGTFAQRVPAELLSEFDAAGGIVDPEKYASQKRLDKLSYEGKGSILSGSGRGARRSKGKRFDAEEKAKRKEIQDRGGFLGQLNRSFTGMLDVLSGGKSRYEEADKASKARVKQAGAAAIGRYYSSSDGKYYKDYAAAVKARDKRLAKQKAEGKAGGGMINVTENLGYDVPGGGADRQFLPGIGFLQPGEKLMALTKDAVDRGAVGMVNSVNAKLDSNSNAWKDGVKPLPPRSSSMMELPPEFLDQSSKDGGSMGSGSEVPEYDTSPASGAAYRAQVKSYYGIA